MQKASIFVRGQVWYWNDPIYGEKSENKDVNRGECTLRYSRYVIIAQTTETINPNKGILVIPCSARSSSDTDVELRLAHPFAYSRSYARVNMMFPISPTFLDRYICTIPNSSIEMINHQLHRILFEADPVDIQNLEFIEYSAGIETMEEFDENKEIVEEEVDTEDEGEIDEEVIEHEQVIIDVPITEEIKDVFTEDENDVVKPYDESSILYWSIKPSISKFAHMVSRYLRSEGVYYTITSKHVSKQKMISFYGQVDEVIFRSLLNFMGIKTDDNGVIYPDIKDDDPYINTWLFFSRIYNDRRISHEKFDPVILINEYRKYYGNEIINNEWKHVLQEFMLNRMKLNQNQMQYVSNIICSNFCN